MIASIVKWAFFVVAIFLISAVFRGFEADDTRLFWQTIFCLLSVAGIIDAIQED